MTVSEFLSDCGLCPECGNEATMIGYKTNEPTNDFSVLGRCTSELCGCEWKYVIAMEEI